MDHLDINWIRLDGYKDPPIPPIGMKIEIGYDDLLGVPVDYRFVPPFDDRRRTHFQSIFRNNHLGTYSSWCIFRLFDRHKKPILYLGVRTHHYETDYDYIANVTYNEAVFLINHAKKFFGYNVTEFLDAMKEFPKETPNQKKEQEPMSNTVYYVESGEVKSMKLPHRTYSSYSEAEAALVEMKRMNLQRLREEVATLEAELEYLPA